MTFLPEDDRAYLAEKLIKYDLLSDPTGPGTSRNGIVFPEYGLPANLFSSVDGQLVPAVATDLMILVPAGYATTKLDSFYTLKRLKRSDGTEPVNANGEQELFGKKWQFWSRHLDDSDWRDGIDGLSTFLEYIRRELRVA